MSQGERASKFTKIWVVLVRALGRSSAIDTDTGQWSLSKLRRLGVNFGAAQSPKAPRYGHYRRLAGIDCASVHQSHFGCICHQSHSIARNARKSLSYNEFMDQYGDKIQVVIYDLPTDSDVEHGDSEDGDRMDED
ncbi:hypothetical protein K438DRAFT_1762560 [Mycena galopus ATCC 62051]|nr:hypothetical protein K438DRAFT_1762560 [Mycena galopus ATCC 62051]